MRLTCIVVNCGSRGDRDRRRHEWLIAINREDLTDSKIKYQRVCSKHFVTGKPAALEDLTHPDWAPSLNMGYKSKSTAKNFSNLERKNRADRRKRMQAKQANPVLYDLSKCCDAEPNSKEQETGIASQTDLAMDEIIRKFEQLSFATNKITELENKLEKSPFELMEEEA